MSVRHPIRRVLCAICAMATAMPVAAQTARVPVRPVGSVVAGGSDTLGSVISLRALPDGRVLVNDPVHRRILLYDEALTRATTIVDSTTRGGVSYGRVGGLLPFRADSSLFVDPFTLSVFVIDKTGSVGRTMAVPDPDNVMALVGLQSSPGVDPSGRIIYSDIARANGATKVTNGIPTFPEEPDSTALLRLDLGTRRVDTITYIKTRKVKRRVSQDSAGRMTIVSEMNPLPIVDTWAVLPDGVVAVVRGRDYHVDYYAPEGTRRVGSKLPFAWQHLSDKDKADFIDSVVAARARLTSHDGGQAMATAKSTNGPGTSGRAGGIVTGSVAFVPPSELPDYRPPFFANAAHADARGNLWIETVAAHASPGGPVYDVVSPGGRLIDRVQVPAKRSILGFGVDDTAYLAVRESPAAPHILLERVHVR